MDTLHIYSQDAWHDTAYIVGDRQSLTTLRDCLTKALETESSQKFNTFTNDGEGYTVEVTPLDNMDGVRLPYTADYASDTSQQRKGPHQLSRGAEFLEVSAEVRYWEDSDVNGEPDIDGSRIPHRSGKLWVPIIRLKDGQIMNWPQGTTAKIFYKVCDQGEYWLRNDSRRLFKYKDYYVPDTYLCQIYEGYGDYIGMTVDYSGRIVGWKQPKFDPSKWDPVQ